jgi:hypothetical protein
VTASTGSTTAGFSAGSGVQAQSQQQNTRGQVLVSRKKLSGAGIVVLQQGTHSSQMMQYRIRDRW